VVNAPDRSAQPQLFRQLVSDEIGYTLDATFKAILLSSLLDAHHVLPFNGYQRASAGKARSMHWEPGVKPAAALLGSSKPFPYNGTTLALVV